MNKEKRVTFSEHKHGEQWGIVVNGKIELTIEGITKTYIRGDSYHIPANTLHNAIIYPGFKAVDYFADKKRYKAKIMDKGERIE